jgi:hypothetical protein
MVRVEAEDVHDVRGSDRAGGQALAWSADNPEAFAGTHETHVLGVFDEASAIDRSIFNVFAGAMTTPGARWLLLGNSTQNEGYFYDAVHGKLKARKPGDLQRGMWNSFVIPSTASPFVDPNWVEDMRAQHGEDSDEFRVRVLGLPPRVDAQQYIPREFVLKAMDRTVDMFSRWPLVLGCDVGRGDRSVMIPRRGRKVLNNIQVFTASGRLTSCSASRTKLRFYRDEHDLKAQVIIEELGMGVGVVETLEDMGYAEQVWGVNTGVGERGRQGALHQPPQRNVGRDARVARGQRRAAEQPRAARRPHRHQAQAEQQRQGCASRRRTRCAAAACARPTLATRSR